MVLFRNMVSERLGVNVTDMECLGLLYNKDLATPSELARYTGLGSGATTAMLDRLEKSGLIERRPNPDDRRGTHRSGEGWGRKSRPLVYIGEKGARRTRFKLLRKRVGNLKSHYYAFRRIFKEAIFLSP